MLVGRLVVEYLFSSFFGAETAPIPLVISLFVPACIRSFLDLRCLNAFLLLFGDVGCPPLALRSGFSFKEGFSPKKGTWLYWISSPIVEEQIGSHLHVSSFVGLVATRTPTYLYGNKANDKAKVADSYR
jgi:hypothetical protein